MFTYGICGNILKWFDNNYLTNRSQFIIYNTIQSETHNIIYGIPQGSILGPLLFIIYMNDICNVSELLYTIMYADHTRVIINLLNTWLKSNKLSLNVNKTYYLVFHNLHSDEYNK